ncbi:MAG: elongation factor G [Balneolales bacterium]
MIVYHPSKVRNVVLLGHSGSGKTTLAETMLFESGAISRRGTIEEGNTTSDYNEVEKDKLKSVYSSFMNLEWRGHKINLIDTPGTTDYSGEVLGALKVADTAIFVLDAEHGVEVGTEILWNYARKYKTPSFFVINKIDHPNADFQRTLDLARELFGRHVVPVQYPYNEKGDFNAIIDVLKMTMYEFPKNGGKPDKLPIPDSHKAQAELLHNELIEAIAENDEVLMDIYFEKGTLGENEMRQGMRNAMTNGDFCPLFCASALRNMGSGRIMGFIDNVAPSPMQTHPDNSKNGKAVDINPDEKTAAFMFKTVSEEHVGDLMYFKTITGSMKPGIDLVNHSTGGMNRIGSLFLTQGHKRIEVPEIKAGDIGAVVKLKDAGVNDTLHEKGYECVIDPVEYPEPTIRAAIRTHDQANEEKLGAALNQIQREDPSLSIEHSQELKQIIISGQGEEHLAMVKHRLSSRFKVDVEYYKPGIPYRETITKAVRSHYKHKKQSGGAGQYAEVYMLVEPLMEEMPEYNDITVRKTDEIDLPWGGKLVFRNCIVGGVIDNRFMPAILKGIMDKLENGPMSGSRARDVRVSVYDGSMHAVDSNEAAFKTAGTMAFKKGFLDANPQLLEPTYKVEISIPAEFMGDVMSDLATRRGQILGMDSEGSFQTVTALVPLAELYRYATHLKSKTQGRGTHTRTFDSYTPVPGDIQDKVMKETAKLEEA